MPDYRQPGSSARNRRERTLKTHGVIAAMVQAPASRARRMALLAAASRSAHEKSGPSGPLCGTYDFQDPLAEGVGLLDDEIAVGDAVSVLVHCIDIVGPLVCRHEQEVALGRGWVHLG